MDFASLAAALWQMKMRTPALAEIVKLRGTVTLGEFIVNGIQPGPTTIDRTLLYHVRHWSEIINHDEVLKRYAAERAANEPVTVRLRQEAKAEERLIRDAEKVLANAAAKEAKSIAKADGKAQEKERVSHLTAAKKKR